MRLGVLFSSGKDSCLALHLAKEYGHQIACLLTVTPDNKDSFMFHTPALEWVGKQAEALGIPLLRIETRGEKEEELGDLKKVIEEAVRKYKIRGIVTGAVRSIYQASRVQRICNLLHIECFNPLWMRNEEEHVQDLLERNFHTIVTRVSAQGLGREWIGREMNQDFFFDLKKLHEKYHINLAGEGGEYESFVLDAPLFKKRLEIAEKRVDEKKNVMLIQKIKLISKKKERR